MPVYHAKNDIESIVARQVEEWAEKFQAHYDEKLSIVYREQKETLAIVNRLGKYVNHLEHKVSSIPSNPKFFRDENGEINFPPVSNDVHSPVKISNANDDLLKRVNMLESFCGYDPEKEAYSALGLGTGELVLPEHRLSSRLDRVDKALLKLDRNMRQLESDMDHLSNEKDNENNSNGGDIMATNGLFFPEKGRPKSTQGMPNRPGHGHDHQAQGHGHTNAFSTPHPPAHNGTFGYRSAPSKSRTVSGGRPNSAPNVLPGGGGANKGGNAHKLLDEVRSHIDEVDSKNQIQNSFLMNELQSSVKSQEDKTDRKLRSVEAKLRQQVAEVDEQLRQVVSEVEQAVRIRVQRVEAALQRQEKLAADLAKSDFAQDQAQQKQAYDRLLEDNEKKNFTLLQEYQRKELDLQRELQQREVQLRTRESDSFELCRRLQAEAGRLHEENAAIREEHAKHVAQLEHEFEKRQSVVDERTELYKEETRRLREVHQQMQNQVNEEIIQRTGKLESEKEQLQRKLAEEATLHARQAEKDRMVQDTLQGEVDMFKKSCSQAHHDKELVLIKLKTAEMKYSELESRLQATAASSASKKDKEGRNVPDSPRHGSRPGSGAQRPPSVQVPLYEEQQEAQEGQEEEGGDGYKYDTPMSKFKYEHPNAVKRADTPIPQPLDQGSSKSSFQRPAVSPVREQSRDMKKQDSREYKKQDSREVKQQSSKELKKQSSTASSASRPSSRDRAAQESSEGSSRKKPVGVAGVDDSKLLDMVHDKLTQNDIDDILVLEELIKDKEAELQTTAAAKARAKKKIKTWMNDFQRAHNRAPSQSEKEAMADLYMTHQQLSDERLEHEVTLGKMRATLQVMVDKVVT